LTSKVAPETIGYWLHEVVRNNSTLAGVRRENSGVIRYAWQLRVRADYSPDSVTEAELRVILIRAQNVLVELGLNIEGS